MAAAKLDEYWSHLRMTDPDLIEHNLLRQSFKFYFRNTPPDMFTVSKARITLSEALETYLAQRVRIRARPSMPLVRGRVLIWLRRWGKRLGKLHLCLYPEI